MINLSTSGNAVVFTFTDSDRYLYGTGTITVPLNSLLLVTDNSQMATFKKAASNDVFVSALYSELGMTKDELISWFEENAVGSTGGIESGDVQTMIDEATSGKADTSAVTESINAAVSGKADTSAVTASLSSKLDEVRVDPKTPTSNYTQLNLYLRKENSGSQSLFTYVKTINGKSITSQNNNNLEGFSLIETSAITSSVTSASTDSEIPSAKAVWDAIPASITVDSAFDSGSTNPLANSAITDHLNTVESVIATSLVDLDNRKLDASAYTPTDLSNYYTSAQTESAITAAVSGKQDTLVAGDNITISGNVISAEGGGGASYSAGTNISIDTANTISCTLPISVTSSNQNSIRVGNGNGNNASADNCIIAGESVSISYKNSIGVGASIQIGASNSVGVGQNVQTSNDNEFAGGFYNVSNKVNTTRGDSGNTLFSVGNGYIHNPIRARHNAFEIRQNGDLYVADVDDTTYSNYYEKPMKRLQDYIQFKIAKLSQSEYDALVQAGTVDASTVYFITNSNS